MVADAERARVRTRETRRPVLPEAGRPRFPPVADRSPIDLRVRCGRHLPLSAGTTEVLI